MDYSNFTFRDLAMQVLSRQLDIFMGRHSGGFVCREIIASGMPVSIPGVSGASYTASLNPLEPAGVFARIDGLPGGKLLLGLRRFAFDTTAVTAFLPADLQAVALANKQREVA